MKIFIAGGGNMGKTYADSFISDHTIKQDDLYILEHYQEKVDHFKSIGFKNVFHTAGSYISEMDIIILAVKPQDSEALFPLLAPFVNEKQLILSIMAGVKMSKIAQSLPNARKIVRAMPNLPAQIGMGMTGFTSVASVDKGELIEIHNLLNTTGKALYFDKEDQLDAVTAISGSGPAYVYYFMDAMTQAAMQMGFSQNQAELLVEQTFLGAVHLQKRSDLSCQDWIKRVASKGGTTEAAINYFGQQQLDQNIINGLKQALQRAIDLGK